MTPTKPKPPGDITLNIPVLWDLQDPPPPNPANLFVVMARPGEVLLTFGFAAPLIAGTIEEQKDQGEKLATTGMKPGLVARYVLSEVVARQLHTVLGQQLAGLEHQKP